MGHDCVEALPPPSTSGEGDGAVRASGLSCCVRHTAEGVHTPPSQCELDPDVSQ